jgi:hypothetical protein
MQAAAGSVQVRGGCAEARFWDAWTGEVARAEVGPDGSVPVRLAALESVFLACGDGAEPEGTVDRPAWARRIGDGATSLPLQRWHLRVEGPDVEGGLFEGDLDGLQDWRALPALRSAGSPGRYTTTVELPADPGRAELDLGWIQGVARVWVNGAEAGELLVSPFRLEITDRVRPGANTLEVEVRVPLRNRLIGQAEAGDPLAAQFQGKGDTRIGSGLLGPAFLRLE